MNRRLLVILASIVVVLGLAVALYMVFVGNRPTLSVGEPTDIFGSSGDRGDSPVLTPDGRPVQGAGTVVAPRLVRISDVPAAKGAAAIYIPEVIATSTEQVSEQKDTEIRFIERQSGNIYAFRFHDRVLSRISNRTLPGIQEAVWVPDGSLAFVRYLSPMVDGTEQIDTYALPAGDGEGYFLTAGIGQILLAGTERLLSILPVSSGSVGNLSEFDGGGSTTLFSSPLTSIAASPSGSGAIITNRPSNGLDGYAFRIGSDGSSARIAGPLRGLSALGNQEGTYAIYSYVAQNRVFLQALNLSTRETIALPLATLAEKCVWTPGGQALYCAVPTTLTGNLPDDWYQGVTSFTDRIWHIDLTTRLATLIVDPMSVGEVAIDAVSLSLDSEADVLVFSNKRDGTLWAYDL